MSRGAPPGDGLRGLLVGYGSIGRRHLSNLHELGVSDWGVVHTGAGTVAFEPPCPVRAYPTLAEALDAEEPDFAVVANPTAMHLTTTMACIRRECAVMVEKPVSHSLDGVDLLVETATSRASRLLVGFQFRFHPALHRIRALLHDSVVGRAIHARVVWGEYLPDWHPWEDWRRGYAARSDLGGGVHHTICHPFDYLRMLFGDAEMVHGSLSQAHPLGLEVAEAADVLIRFAGGIDAEVHLDYWTRPQTHRLEITGTDGSIVWDFIGGELRLWDATQPGWQVEPVPGVGERNELFVAQSRHFLDVVTQGAEPVCTLPDGIAALQIAHAVEDSSRRHMAPVALAERRAR